MAIQDGHTGMLDLVRYYGYLLSTQAWVARIAYGSGARDAEKFTTLANAQEPPRGIHPYLTGSGKSRWHIASHTTWPLLFAKRATALPSCLVFSWSPEHAERASASEYCFLKGQAVRDRYRLGDGAC